MSDAVRVSRDLQRLAADPQRSVALAAAAGSGKTKVLVDRYVRLCLAGADPRSILAVTFTRKATVEIKGRMLRAALDFARAGGDDLARAVVDLIGTAADDATRARAAWLLEALFEDPAGLPVGTIHAFCQQVIGRFAAVAGLDPRYGVLEREIDLQDEALDLLEEELARDPDAARDFAQLAGSPADARRRLASLFTQRVHLQRWVDRVVPPPAGPALALARPLEACAPALAADLAAALAAGDASSRALALSESLRDLVTTGLAQVVAAEAGKPTEAFLRWRDETAAELQAAADLLAADPAAWAQVADRTRQALLTGGALRKPGGRKDTKEARLAAYTAAVTPVVAALQRGVAVEVAAGNARLLRHGLRAFDLYGDLKRRDRVLDFQDLEYLALRLLTDDTVRAQVHQRLDARLDHLLLDEFQDTNRNQWDLLTPLLEEMLAGGDPPRSGFLVGDVKQAIYGFRGADPTIFAEAAALVQRAGGDVLELPTNFRSLPAVVDAVGLLFQHEPLRGFLGSVAPSACQLTARVDEPGEVVFVDPFQDDDTASAHAAAAAAVVQLVRHLVREGVSLGDILVLCRRKTHIALYEMALRRAQIPLVPAGRGLLARSREVQDVLALLRWLTFPADDVAGAAVLRSPFARLPEEMVQSLLAARLSAPGRRRRTLWEVVHDAPDLAAFAALLREWHQHAGLDAVHDLLRRIYRTGDVLARMEVAFGEQARFNLLRLIDVALAADAAGGSARDLADELERVAVIGGEEEGALPHDEGGRVRVMTVHAAKGLESPIVIMIDAAADAANDLDRLPLGPQGPLIFGRLGDLACGPLCHDESRLPAPLAEPFAAASRRQIEEEAHILYVAMTRARDRLYVLGAHGRTAPRASFHAWLAAAAESAEAPGPVPWRRLAPAAFLAELTAAKPAAAGATAAVVTTHPVRLWTPPVLAPRARTENPSRLAQDDRADDPLADADVTVAAVSLPTATPAADAALAARHGTLVHLWLERAAQLGVMPAGDGPAWAEAAAVFANPSFGWVFAPQREGGRGLCEQPVIHRRGREGRTEVRMLGTIDRLVLRPGRVDIVDYKSNRVTVAGLPALRDHYAPQIEAYRQALAAIWPDRVIGGWLLFTQVSSPLGQGQLVEVTTCP